MVYQIIFLLSHSLHYIRLHISNRVLKKIIHFHTNTYEQLRADKLQSMKWSEICLYNGIRYDLFWLLSSVGLTKLLILNKTSKIPLVELVKGVVVKKKRFWFEEYAALTIVSLVEAFKISLIETLAVDRNLKFQFLSLATAFNFIHFKCDWHLHIEAIDKNIFLSSFDSAKGK